MMTQAEKSQYERTSNAAAGYCAVCTKPLEPDETYSCNECASDAYVETKRNGDSDEEAEKEV